MADMAKHLSYILNPLIIEMIVMDAKHVLKGALIVLWAKMHLLVLNWREFKLS
jgi:hypothetical protein